MARQLWITSVITAAVSAAALAQSTAPVPPSPGPSMLAAGYLPRGAAPDSLKINPPPPAPRSAALARDVEAQRAALRLQGSPRWEQAAVDANLFTPNATGVFSCAAGFAIGAETTPKLNALLRKAGPDLAMAVYPSKRQYQRARPFMVNKRPTCTPQDEKMLAKDGSYPSGHSAIGYGWGLILAEIVPDRAAQLAARGQAFGDSRRVCNVHWLSDVEQGRAVASAVLARLHAEASFRADIEAARAEVEQLRLKNIAAPDCATENGALGTN